MRLLAPTPRRTLGKLGTLIVLQLLLGLHVGWADSAIPVLSGFDRERIQATYPPSDDASLSELAKLAYRVRAIAPRSLEQLVDGDGDVSAGDAIKVEGLVTGTSTLRIPANLVEFLEFSQLHALEVQQSERLVRLYTLRQPTELQVGDRIAAVGVVIAASQGISASEGITRDDQPSLVVVSASVQWFPAQHRSEGQRLLGEAGFDLGLIAETASRNRRPLLAEDGDAFYRLLGAARILGDRSDVPSPTAADPVALLRNPQDHVGAWVRLELESVQITRIAVTQRDRQEQMGGDHYYQIDAMGDLGRVVIQIEQADKSLPPARFQNRYPISLVTMEIPDFLRDQLGGVAGAEAIVAPVRMKIGVDGFFYRLWGYESEFMSQYGGGQQFGPLLVAWRIENREPVEDDPVGVGTIGTAAAVVVLSAMTLIWWWQRRAWAGDDEARRRRQESRLST